MQLYSREPYGAEDVGVGYLAHEEISFDTDGRFTVELGPSLAFDLAGATILQVREIYDSWSKTAASELVIELIDAPGPPQPRSVDEVTAMFARAAHDLERSAEAWPSLIADRALRFLEPNSVAPLRNPGGSAGVEGRWMTIGPYRLDGSDTAVVVSLCDTGAEYVGIELADLWMASLEYADASSSRTGGQSHRAPDGRMYHVISLEDPGYQNWLDPVGVATGIVHVRIDGLTGVAEPWHQPTLTQTTTAELRVRGDHSGILARCALAGQAGHRAGPAAQAYSEAIRPLSTTAVCPSGVVVAAQHRLEYAAAAPTVSKRRIP